MQKFPKNINEIKKDIIHSFGNTKYQEIDAIITHWVQHKEVVPPFADKRLITFIQKKFQENGINAVNFKKPKKPRFSFIDLFAGIGGFRIALQNWKGNCLFSSEWDESAKETYFRNFGEIPYGDINMFTSSEIPNKLVNKLIPDHDLLAAGFPCQPFSHAGVSARENLGQSHGFECKTQGTLFFSIERIAKIKKPKILLLENVKNIVGHNKKHTFKIIKKAIESLGYSFNWKVIDSSSLVPQKRNRCFMVCVRGGIKFNFPEFSKKELPLKSILEKKVGNQYTISDKLWAGHQRRTQRNIKRGTGFTAFEADIQKPANTLVARYGKDGKECLIPQKEGNPRMLTPRECSRLQGFPENFIIPNHRTPAYKQFGNSVPVPVVEKLIEAILKQKLL
jgi:DNA (cytosine-5)-methyltransferase 1